LTVQGAVVLFAQGHATGGVTMREEFASYSFLAVTVAGVVLLCSGLVALAVLEPPAAIPAEHSARLIELGYIAHLEGRLRMTTAGRYRIAAAENQNRSAPKAIN
jgi:hypothetical protein